MECFGRSEQLSPTEELSCFGDERPLVMVVSSLTNLTIITDVANQLRRLGDSGEESDLDQESPALSED